MHPLQNLLPARLLLALTGLSLIGSGAGCDDLQPVDPRLCNPVTAEGCPTGFICRLVAGGVTDCLAPAEPPANRVCQPGTCDPGEACATIEGALGCHPVCALDDDQCVGLGACTYLLGPDSDWGICAPHCTLAEPCAGDLSCVPTAGLTHLVCAASGPAAQGAPCDDAQRCQLGLACLISEGRATCRQLCDPVGPAVCDAGACIGQIMQADDVGYCAGG
jgi:hypothetical protein